MRSLAARLSQPLQYDAPRRRLWILGQRCHHGATGSLMAAAGCLGLLAAPASTSGASWRTLAVAAGSAMMAHDWKDRAIWFERGYGSQP
jgi:hypothetical protein